MYPGLYTLIFFVGFYAYYATSERAEVPASVLKTWARRWRLPFRCISLVLIAISMVAFIRNYGVGAGFFIGLCLLMSIASVIVLCVPLRKLLK